MTNETRAPAVDSVGLPRLAQVLARKASGEQVKPIGKTGRELAARDIHGHRRLREGAIVINALTGCGQNCPCVGHELAEQTRSVAGQLQSEF